MTDVNEILDFEDDTEFDSVDVIDTDEVVVEN